MSAPIDIETIRDTLAYIHDDLLGHHHLTRARHAIHLAIAALPAYPSRQPPATFKPAWRPFNLSADNDARHVSQSEPSRFVVPHTRDALARTG